MLEEQAVFFPTPSSTLPRNDSTTAEFIEVHVLDGSSTTIVSASTQTDWEWVEQALTDSCQGSQNVRWVLGSNASHLSAALLL